MTGLSGGSYPPPVETTHRAPLKLFRPALLVALLLPAGLAHAQGWDPGAEGGEVFVVQERPVRLHHEFSFGAGMLPLDAFYTGYSIGASYTYHPSDVIAWEVARAFLVNDIESGLQEELLERFEVQPTRFEKVVAGVFSNLVLKPFYGKRAFSNTSVWPAETSFLLGAGAVRYSQSLRAALDFGVTFRLHLADRFSVRFTVLDMLPVDINGELDNVLLLSVAGAFNFGGNE